MKNFQKILLNIVTETSNIFWVLFKVILPVVVFIRFLELMGAIPYLAKFLDPLTGFIGIDGIPWHCLDGSYTCEYLCWYGSFC
jgi:hypothetical protein